MNQVRILVVEDSKMFANVISSEIRSRLGFECKIASTLKETKVLLESEGADYFLAVVDLNLPDASNEEIVDYIVSKGIPPIIFTGNFADDMRDRILTKDVVDYVLKEGLQDVDYLVRSIHRIYKNQDVTVLVVDDSGVSRLMIRTLLQTQKFTVLEANNGKEGLEVLRKNPQVKLVISDYNMPQMDGFEFISTIRKKHSSDQLAVIGISAHGSGQLSAKFLKRGANDFITKPFVKEEFYCRVNQNVEMLEYIEAIQDASNKDYLTGLYNRRYFFDLGNKMYENARRGNLDITVAMLDIDHFKKINDTYGHDAGDTALKVVANIISNCIRQADLVARFGGEEFCVLATNMKKEKTHFFFDELRKHIGNEVIPIEGGEISLTVSIGVTTKLSDSLAKTINLSDELLYQAKESGRNKVVVD
ncbi:MAG: diguanylate cyclase [bacterium]|nr:diguanylate cyclase [bacterium]